MSSEQHIVDILVGQEIKRRRVMRGMSQYDLAQKLGITFQQVQKYERGINRVVVSRLYELSKALAVNITEFFMKLPLDINDGKSSSFDAKYISSAGEDDTGFKYENDIDNKEILMLVRAYMGINNYKIRNSVYNLIKSLSTNQDNLSNNQDDNGSKAYKVEDDKSEV